MTQLLSLNAGPWSEIRPGWFHTDREDVPKMVASYSPDIAWENRGIFETIEMRGCGGSIGRNLFNISY